MTMRISAPRHPPPVALTGFGWQATQSKPSTQSGKASVAAALLARDRAAVVPLNRRGHHLAVSLSAYGDATWADADCRARVISRTIPIPIPVAVPIAPDLNINALGHLDSLGFGRSDRRGSHQQGCGSCRGERELDHADVLLRLDLEAQRA